MVGLMLVAHVPMAGVAAAIVLMLGIAQVPAVARHDSAPAILLPTEEKP